MQDVVEGYNALLTVAGVLLGLAIPPTASAQTMPSQATYTVPLSANRVAHLVVTQQEVTPQRRRWVLRGCVRRDGRACRPRQVELNDEQARRYELLWRAMLGPMSCASGPSRADEVEIEIVTDGGSRFAARIPVSRERRAAFEQEMTAAPRNDCSSVARLGSWLVRLLLA